jgi:polyribonucleotide nucleotidyltransferase
MNSHHALVYSALLPSLPSEAEFPYSIRVESLITESHGSSSMASVCGGSLALMDAGVPIKSSVAGIAMGLLIGSQGGVSDDNAVILSDILGTEDALGTMDFKVAGDRTGVSTFQLDIKCEGLSLEIMQRALEQARVGRLHILDEMEKVISSPRSELPPTVPKMRLFNVPYDSIGKIIGPGGKQIRAIIEDFKLTNMDVKDDGNVQITGMDTEQLIKAEEFVTNLIKGSDRGPARGGKKDGGRPKYEGPMAEVGDVYEGKITGIHSYGVFLEILPGAEDGSTPGLEGLCHVSELHTERVRNCEGFVKSLGVDTLKVRFLGINEKGQLRLSRKDVQEDPDGTRFQAVKLNSSTSPDMTMPEDEVDIIAKAIEGLSKG